MHRSGTYMLATRGTAVVALLFIGVTTLYLALLVGPGVALVISCLIVGPAVHVVMGKAMQRRPERWGALGDGIIVAGITYPLLLWIGGTIFVAATVSLPLAAVVLLGPVVLFVVYSLVADDNRGPRRAALRRREAFAAQHGWRFLADGSDVLRDHWAAAPGEQPDVAVSAVLAGELDGWPVTICDTVDHRPRCDANLTVTWLVHLPASLPHTVAVPYASREFARWVEGRPWEPTPVQGYPLRAEDLQLASADAAFAARVATPEVRRATVDGDIMFWRIIGRDLSLARRAAGRRSVEDVLATASRLVALARALPADSLAAFGTPPSRPLPFREPSPS